MLTSAASAMGTAASVAALRGERWQLNPSVSESMSANSFTKTVVAELGTFGVGFRDAHLTLLFCTAGI